ALVDLHLGEVVTVRVDRQAEHLGEELGRGDPVLGGHDGMVQANRHRCPPARRPPGSGSGAAADAQFLASRNARIAAIVAAGCSSMSQWPESGMTTSVTLLAALRMTTASVAPNDFAPPIARTGMASGVAIEARWSATSAGKERNWAKAERIAPGCA